MKTLFRIISNLFRNLFRILSLLRVVVINVLFVVVLVLLVIPFMISKESEIESNSALLLSLDGNIVEEKQSIDPFSELLNDFFGVQGLSNELLLQDILDAISFAAEDEKISCIILDLKNLGQAGLNQLTDIGTELNRFQDSGKKVIAAEDYFLQKQYYIASFADTIFLNPMGGVDLHGFGLFKFYYKEALEKLRINYHVFRVGAYKSATEPLTRDSMSEKDRQQNIEWLSSLWQSFTHQITNNRKLPKNAIDKYANNIPSELALTGGNTAQLALSKGLIDELKTRDQLLSYFASITAPKGKSDFRHVKLKEYVKSIEKSYEKTDNNTDKVGIIVAKGNILNGRRPPGTIGGDSLAQLIQQARFSNNIKSVVLRIDSGGGSAFASEIIRQELLALKKSGKPLVVSMGTIAASGGYWISANADKILAAPTTITGSIGIFGAIPTFENSLAEIGIKKDGVGTNSLASGLDLSQPLSPLLKETIQLTLNHGYEKFISIVEEGRNMSKEQLDLYAQGRVFDGRKAMEIGLVDEIGNLRDAVTAAAEFAGLDTYSAEYILTPSPFTAKIFKHLGKNMLQHIFTAITGEGLSTHLLASLSPVTLFFPLDDPQGIYAHSMLSPAF